MGRAATWKWPYRGITGRAIALRHVALGPMSQLSALLEPGARTTAVKELSEPIDATLANQSGLTGMTLKPAIAALEKADADAIPKGVGEALPELVRELDPFWNAYENSGTQGFGAYLASREDDVVNALLSAGDAATERMPGAIRKVYSTLRGKAGKIVGPALPQFGGIVEKYAA